MTHTTATSTTRRPVFNREPLAPNPFAKLPVGSIRPEGWLRAQLELMADGLTGRLPERSKFCQRQSSAWTNPEGRGENPWEEAPYWLKGFGDLGRILDDQPIIDEFNEWIEGVLANRTPDGFFGPRGNIEEKAEGGFGPIAEEDLDLWPNMIMLDVLRAHYDATADPRVIELMLAYARWLGQLDRPTILPGYWDRMRGGDNLDSVLWLYNITAESFLLDVAKRIHDCTADWIAGVPNQHGVNITQGFREPAIWAQISKDNAHTDAVERNYRTVKDEYGHVPGGMFGADENARPGRTDPRQGAEACSMVEFMRSFQILCRITGDPVWAERCEEVALNDFPPSHTADLKALHYLTAPNQPMLDRLSKAPGVQNAGDMFSYDPRRYRCCQHNVSHGWPGYAQHLFVATREGGLAALLYAPCTISTHVAGDTPIELAVRTNYPFDDRIDIALTALDAPARFPLMLRIPHWCDDASIRLNDQTADIPAAPGSFATIDREWSAGDRVTLTLPMRTQVIHWPRNHDAVSIRRGPLWYSLAIEERENVYWSEADWKALELLPGSPWNFGLDLDEAGGTTRAAAESIRVATSPGPDADLPRQPFSADTAPVTLSAPMRAIDNWQLEPNNLIQELQDSPVRTDAEPVRRTLIPMGCARLRVSAFPQVAASASRTWEPPSAADELAEGVITSRLHRASHADLGEQVTEGAKGTAVSWEPVTGTEEWAIFRFDEPQRVGAIDIYWLDDAGQGNARVPERWSIDTEDMDGSWTPVRHASAFGTEKDTTNRTTFMPTLTHAVRINVKLKDGHSAAILRFAALGGGY